MTWVAVAVGGGAVLGAVVSSSGQQSAANTAARSADAAAAEQRREFDITQGNAAPYITVGQQAINRLGSIYGYSSSPSTAAPSGYTGNNLPTGGTSVSRGGQVDPSTLPVPYGHSNGATYSNGAATSYNNLTQSANPATPGAPAPVAGTPAAPAAGAAPLSAPDYSSFFKSPDYQFRQQQGTQGIENSFSASGGAKSGNALKALADFNSNLASGEFGNYFNRQAALAGVGQTATGQVGAAGVAAGGQIGNSLIAGGDARASGIAGQYNAIGTGLSGAAQGLGYYLKNSQTPNNDLTYGEAMSDPRLKTDVKRVGKTDAGLPIYRFRMKGDGKMQMGVMADEAQKKFPGAVKQGPGGYKKVNYLAVH
ncbi:MAG TPA: hypothetical protein VK626_01540 [Nitrospiraceae bacterium]|nr:hypothetical protein [Nitrospiraceae bacterium]